MRSLVIFQLPFRGRDEFLPLKGDPTLDVRWVAANEYDGKADVIILPGSGRTLSDLQYLRESGGERAVREHLAAGGVVVGVCGGYQMLGRKLVDPFQKQGAETSAEGLGYLPITTVFGPQMMQSRTEARLLVGAGEGGQVTGEEVRSGQSRVSGGAVNGFLTLNRVVARSHHVQCPSERTLTLPDGAASNWNPGTEAWDGLVSSDRKIWGTYLHLIFHNEAFRRTFFKPL